MISACWWFGLIHLALLVSTRSSSGNGTKRDAFPRFEHSLAGPYKAEEKMLVIEGDIKLGVILSVHEHDEMKPCGDRLRETGAVQFVEGVVFAVHNVNTFIQHMLPFNLTLGAVIVDDCAKPVTALTRALHFLPANQYPDQQCYDTCSRKQDNGRTSLRLEDVNRLTFHDVVGVIGAESSPSSMMVAQLLGSFEIPQISPSASSDLLSDKRKYPYFMRMSPPNHYQVKAMSHLIRHFNWTYVAAVYSKGGYGESGVDGLKAHAARDSVCIGAALAISQHASDDDVNMLVTKLVESNAKVVVLFTDQEETRHLLTVIKSQNLIGRFVLVGSDGVGINLDDLDGLEDAALGVLTLKTYSVDVPKFFDYFESLKPCSDTKNPWFVEMWTELFNTTNASLCDPQTSIKDAADYSPESTVSLVMDTVYVFADAIGRLVRDHCPNAQPGGTELRLCLRGPLLLQYLHNTNFTGNNGEVRFDSNGDIRGRYEVMNYQRLPTGGYDAVSVAVWDTVTETLNINDSLIVWNIGGLEPGAVPTSRCGDQCDAGEVYSYFKDTCCWECRKCGPNEITAYNATRCISCPVYNWPNAVNFTSCEPIPPTSMGWQDPMVLLLSSLSAVCICYCCTVCLIYIRHNSDRLIKATSRELSYFMWIGVLMQYLLLFSIVCKPDVFVCYISYTGFNVSFAVVYAPLLTRTNRIYRLFSGGKKGKGLPSLTSPLSQVIIASILVAVQIAINVIVVVASPPEVAHRMPVATEPYVELACDVSMQGFMTSLLYNVLLVVICTYYSFKTRTLPDNFNESRYITLCVYTTLVIWLAFVPSYFTTARAHHQAIVLSSALLLNASVTLLCLYTPKIYAVYTGQAAINFKYNMNTFGGGNGDSVAGHLHMSKSVPNLERPSLQHAPVQADFASDPLVQESSDTNGTSVMSRSVAGTWHNSDCSHVTLTEM